MSFSFSLRGCKQKSRFLVTSVDQMEEASSLRNNARLDIKAYQQLLRYLLELNL